jgi:hypothetical protein
MEAVTLLIAVVALVLAVIAFIRTGGMPDMRRQIDSMSARTEAARDRTADALDRLERFIRGRDKGEGGEPGAHPPGPAL